MMSLQFQNGGRPPFWILEKIAITSRRIEGFGSKFVCTIQYNTIQYKNDFYIAVIEGAESLVGRL